jgi:transposase
VLEERGFQLLLVNARHVRILPGRKTDVGDAAWLAELLEHGLLRGSFVPPPAIRQLRDLTRYRKRLIQAHSAECQRIQKTLQDAGIKLDSVAADILGVSGRAMLRALVAGERDPGVLAQLAKGRLRVKLPSCVRRYAAASATTTGCWSGSPSTTWSTWRPRSPPSTPAWTR